MVKYILASRWSFILYDVIFISRYKLLDFLIQNSKNISANSLNSSFAKHSLGALYGKIYENFFYRNYPFPFSLRVDALTFILKRCQRNQNHLQYFIQNSISTEMVGILRKKIKLSLYIWHLDLKYEEVNLLSWMIKYKF